MNISLLVEQNPWWKDAVYIETDHKMKELGVSKIQWTPRLKAFINLENDRIFRGELP